MLISPPFQQTLWVQWKLQLSLITVRHVLPCDQHCEGKEKKRWICANFSKWNDLFGVLLMSTFNVPHNDLLRVQFNGIPNLCQCAFCSLVLAPAKCMHNCLFGSLQARIVVPFSHSYHTNSEVCPPLLNLTNACQLLFWRRLGTSQPIQASPAPRLKNS